MQHGGDRKSQEIKGPIGPLNQISNQQAADMANVGLNTIKRSKKILKDGSQELIEAVVRLLKSEAT